MLQFPKTLKDFFLPRAVAIDEPPIIRPGLYHFQREVNGVPIRYHLRVDDEGPAILVAAASEALLLSPAGAAAAKGLLDGQSPVAVSNSLPVPDAGQVVEDVRHALEDLGQWDVRYPIFNLVDPALHERPWKLSAPLQADVVVGGEGITKAIVDKLWDARIPHVRFIATPRSEKDTISRCIQHAEDLGMIAGVRLRSAKWLDSQTLELLAQTGIDYLVLPWGVAPALHDEWYGMGDYEALQQIVPEIIRSEVTPVADAALTRASWEELPEKLDRILQLGISHIEVYAIASPASVGPAPNGHQGFDAQELRQLAGWIADIADERQVQLVWLPTINCPENRSHQEIIRQSPRAGGDVTIRVDADGNVLPPRGAHQIVGNLLEDEWETIWNHETFQHYRNAVDRPTRCQECPGLTMCAAYCPADEEGWVTL